MKQSLEQILILEVENNIRINIENEIEKEVEKFRRKLEDRKDQYIVEVMKGIRIAHERNMNSITYRIIFENVTKLERN